MTVSTETPRVWIGCLACYNAGRLVGEWHDADEAGDMTPEDIHGHMTSHEELWCMDHEGFGGLLEGECSPMEAQRLAELIGECEDAGIPVGAYAAYRSMVSDDDDPRSAVDCYHGEWESEKDFAMEWAESTGQMESEPAWPYNCVDWDMATRELMQDFWTAEAPNYGVYVFHH